jgi:Rrf2 family protein
MTRMQISARADYAVRALLSLAAAGGTVTAETLAADQTLPRKFLEAILADLRRAGLLTSQRGPEGGHRLARPAAEISVADVMRAVEGPLAAVRGQRPEDSVYEGVAEPLQTVWVAVRASLRSVLDETSLADIVSGTLPKHVQDLAGVPDAWSPR